MKKQNKGLPVTEASKEVTNNAVEVTSADITDATEIGRNILTGSSAAVIRSLIQAQQALGAVTENEARAGTATVIRGWSSLRVRQAAEAAIEAAGLALPSTPLPITDVSNVDMTLSSVRILEIITLTELVLNNLIESVQYLILVTNNDVSYRTISIQGVTYLGNQDYGIPPGKDALISVVKIGSKIKAVISVEPA